MIIIIDHGQGNIGSLTNALKYLNINHKVVSQKDDASNLEITGFILPGVGTFNSGMENLRNRSLDKIVLDLVDKNIRGMGICLGMQMFCEGSEEDNFKQEGLGIFSGYARKLETKNDIVPNIGWVETINTINEDIEMKESLFNGTFYYVHSYAVDASNNKDVVAQCKHGNQNITAAIYKHGILGVQFHPEKSQQMGMRLLQNYFSE